jgi:transcription factor SPN1
MEDVEFDRSHSKSPLPEAGNDPDDPLRPDIDEENSTPNPPIGDPDQDMEGTEGVAGMADPDDVQEAGLSDNESELSELEDQQFDDDFDASNIAIQERPAQIIDESNLGMISVHKRKRTEGDTERPKTKKKKADRPRRKKAKGDDAEGGEVASGSRKSKRSRKEGRTRGASPEEPDENLTPEERSYI